VTSVTADTGLLPHNAMPNNPNMRKVQMATVFYPGNLGPQNWLITPAALAVKETPPQNILDQKWLVVLTGVLDINFEGNSTAEWLNETAVWTPDGFPLGSDGPPLNSGPLNWAINQYSIPLPPLSPSDYVVVFSLQEWAPFATLSSIFDQDQSINAGYAVNAWRPRHFFNGISTTFSTPQLSSTTFLAASRSMWPFVTRTLGS